jgi:hypothetical protein
MSEVVSIHSARSAATVQRRSTDLNRTGNARDGEAFRIVQRGGRTFHVYGSVEDDNVLELPLRKIPGSTSGATPAA